MSVTIDINGRTVYPQKVQYEFAWHIEDAPEILEHLVTQGSIIHGGDILDEHLEYTYSNWYYTDSHELTKFENIQKSLAVALDYIERFVRNNGTKFYVIIVSEP